MTSSSNPGPPAKVWRAGTLTYTTIGLVILFVWLLWGDFAWAARERTAAPVVQILLRKFNASDTLAGFLVGSLPALLSMIITPVVSYLSDRHRGPWGRRIPYLAMPTPLIVIGLTGLAFSPQIGTAIEPLFKGTSSGFRVLLAIGASWTIFEVACTAANAVFAALINDVVPREVLGRFYGAFRALGLIAGMIIYYWVFGKAEAYYAWIFIGIAVLYGGGFTLMCLRVKEGEYPEAPPMDAARNTRGFIRAAITYFQECFGIPYYWLVFFTVSLGFQMATPVNLFSVFYAKSLHMADGTYGKCVAITYLCSLTLSYPIGVLVDRYHPLRLSLIVQVLYAGACLWSTLCVHDATTFALALVANGVLSGTWLTVMASVYQKILPRAEFAQFASAGAIVNSILIIIIGSGVGMLLDSVHHIYRYTFLLSFIITAVCLVLGALLHAKFMALGGLNNYVAPEGRVKRAVGYSRRQSS